MVLVYAEHVKCVSAVRKYLYSIQYMCILYVMSAYVVQLLCGYGSCKLSRCRNVINAKKNIFIPNQISNIGGNGGNGSGNSSGSRASKVPLRVSACVVET